MSIVVSQRGLHGQRHHRWTRLKSLVVLTVCMVAFQSAHSVKSQAEPIVWVGDQSDCLMGIDTGSYFDGSNWLNFGAPDKDDFAIFDSRQLREERFPYVYFGDHFFSRFPCSDELVQGGVADAFSFTVPAGSWTFDFSTTEPGGDLGGITGTNFAIGTNASHLGIPTLGSLASLTLRGNGEVNLMGPVHMADTQGVTAVLDLDGVIDVFQPSAPQLFAAYYDIGLGGDATVRVAKGASLSTHEQGGPIWVGVFDGGVGRVLVTDGGKVTGSLQVGREIGSAGSVAILGPNSTWTSTGGIVGIAGEGSLLLDGGHLENSADSVVAAQPDSRGAVSVVGGGRWSVNGLLTIGNEGRGALEILSGGHVNSTSASLAYAAGSQATLEMSGSFTNWRVTNRFDVGGSTLGRGGEGDVEVRSGLLSVGELLTVWNQGEIRISSSSAGPKALVAVGASEDAMPDSGLYIGPDATVDLLDGGRIYVGSVEGEVAAPATIYIGTRGVLSGSGNILGTVSNAAGAVVPGESPGILRIDGSYHQAANGLLKLEIGGLTPGTDFDQLLVSADVTLAGTVEVELVNGFVPALGDRFDFIRSGAMFQATDVAVLAPDGLEFLQESANGVFSLTVTAIPEPATILMGAVGVCFLLFWRRCRRSDSYLNVGPSARALYISSRRSAASDPVLVADSSSSRSAAGTRRRVRVPGNKPPLSPGTSPH